MLATRGTFVPGDGAPIKDFAHPAFGGNLGVSRVRWIEKENAELARALSDQHALRSMCRTSLLLCNAVFQAREKLAHLATSPFRSGLYCAIDSSPIDFDRTVTAVKGGAEIFREIKRLFPPKLYLQHLPIVSAAQLGIFLGIKGPVNIFNHSIHGVAHAIAQARLDLETGVVDDALVCAAFSLEDPLVVWRNRVALPIERVLSEGAAYLALSRENPMPGEFQIRDDSMRADFYGIANDLIHMNLSDRRV